MRGRRAGRGMGGRRAGRGMGGRRAVRGMRGRRAGGRFVAEHFVSGDFVAGHMCMISIRVPNTCIC